MISEIFIIASEELKRIWCYKRNVAIIVAFMMFIIVVPVVVLNAALQEVPASSPISRFELLKAFVKIFLFSYSIALAAFLVHGISMDVFISDKKEKALEVLLSGPVSLRGLWLGKTLSLFLVSYPCALFATIAFIISGNYVVTGSISYLPDYAMWAYLFTILPLLCFFIIGITGIGQLVARRFTGVNFMLFLVAFIVMFIPSFIMQKFATVNTGKFIFLYTLITVIIGVATLLFERIMLTKERIVLSS